MNHVILSILEGKSESTVTEWLTSFVDDIVSERIPVENLCIRGKLNADLSKYAVLGEARAGAAWANDTLGKGYRAGSRFLVTIDVNGEYVAFDEPSEIEGFATVGFRHLAERFIVRKIQPYYEIVGWDFQPVVNALHGKTAVEWV